MAIRYAQGYQVVRPLLASFAQLGVSASIVVTGAFFVAEMRFRGYESFEISLIIGIATTFELLRIYIAHLADRIRRTSELILVGMVMNLSGFILFPFLLDTVFVVGVLAILSLGGAVVSSLIDVNITNSTSRDRRGGVSGIIQFSRISGFAIGGIFGSIMYRQVSSPETFVTFVTIMFAMIAVFYIVSFFNLSEGSGKTERLEVGLGSSLREIGKSRRFHLTSLFLLLYSFSLFLQDTILEPFAIDVMGYDRGSIGTLTIVSSVLTLVFVPTGVILESRVGRFRAVTLGESIMTIGLLLLMSSAYLRSESVMFTGIILFGIGSGVLSAPGFAYLLDVAAEHTSSTALMITLFGVLITASRSLSGMISAAVLYLSGSYVTIFLLEVVFAISFYVPLRKLVIQNIE